MHLLVIGAAGRTGREVVSQALAHGHQVTAFVRSQSVGIEDADDLIADLEQALARAHR